MKGELGVTHIPAHSSKPGQKKSRLEEGFLHDRLQKDSGTPLERSWWVGDHEGHKKGIETAVVLEVGRSAAGWRT